MVAVDLKQAVERQSGAARALAISLDAHAARRRLEAVNDGGFSTEAVVVDSYARTAQAIADELTRALARRDHRGLKWATAAACGFGLMILQPTVSGFAQGAGNAAYEQLVDDEQTIRCARDLVDSRIAPEVIDDLKPRPYPMNYSDRPYGSPGEVDWLQRLNLLAEQRGLGQVGIETMKLESGVAAAAKVVIDGESFKIVTNDEMSESQLHQEAARQAVATLTGS